MSEYTKGVWFFDPEIRPHHYGCNIAVEAGNNIAIVHNGESGDAETIANARLMTAAPKMIEALKEARIQLIQESMCCETSNERRNYTNNYIDPITAVIEEAEGKS